ncbi:unnamed protein product [Owenia fusiformis]|uniref:Uncharacterized protein n=1 Tax=Owenia fusiformis TaxID=6347 RepID=A0A8J1U6M6_OWEFU|nr:unnamed protein product [Owenia fusiformis]
MAVIVQLFRRTSNISPIYKTALRSTISTIHTRSQLAAKYIKDNPGLDEPIKYSASAARQWQSQNTFGAPIGKWPWYQPYVLAISTAVFLLYFCVFREENDLDMELGESLYSRVPGMEEQQLRISIQYNREHGAPVKDLEKRLSEVIKNRVQSQ